MIPKSITISFENRIINLNISKNNLLMISLDTLIIFKAIKNNKISWGEDNHRYPFQSVIDKTVEKYLNNPAFF